MKKSYYILILFISLVFVDKAQAQCSSPAITSFSPLSASEGDTVTINGSNFETTSTNNIVFFGAAKATVLTATSTQLKVSVPSGATYNHITVTGVTCNLIGYSSLYFNPISICSASFSTSTVDARIDYTSPSSNSGPYGIRFGDFDLDGKTDVLYTTGFSSMLLARNQSVAGIIDLSTIITVVNEGRNLAVADFNGDGKLDIVYVSDGLGGVKVILNTSSGPGNFSFGSALSLTTGGSYNVAAGDIDGDGKPDIAATNGSNVAVFRNTTSGGTLSFGTIQRFATGGSSTDIGLADLDGDNKVELICNGDALRAFRNTSSSGTISFGSAQSFGGGSGYRIAIGDLNGDGLNDVISSNLSGSGVTCYRNTSTSGSVSFASSTNLSTTSLNHRVSISDLNSDGKPDIMSCYSSNSYASCLINTTSSSTSITVGSEIKLTTTGCAYALGTADIDGDGNSDILAGDWCSNRKLHVFRNNVLGRIAITNAVTPVSGLGCSDTLYVSYTAPCRGTDTTNVFTAQLSGPTGSFAFPTDIGRISSYTSDTIMCILPACIATGTGYRVRVNGSRPFRTGAVNPTNISITCQTINSTSITTGTITPTSYCAGNSISIPYTTTGNFGACSSNTFTAQISDAGGSFASPINIGTLVSDTSGTISGTLPSNLSLGTSYRIRVVGNEPITLGSINGSNISIVSAPIITSCPGDITVNLTSGCTQVVTYSAASATGSATITYSKNSGSTFSVGTTVVTVIATNGCGSDTCWFNVTLNGSSTETCAIGVTASGTVYTGGDPKNIYIGYGSQTATLAATGMGGNVTWSPTTNLSCSTCTTTVFTATTEGTFTYTATGCNRSCTVTIVVKNILDASAGTGKVFICHKEPVSNIRGTQSVLLRGVPTHLTKHPGDYLGKCVLSKHENVADLVIDEKDLEVTCTPNPFHSSFTLNYSSSNDAEATILLYGMTGNLIEKINLSGLSNEVELGNNLAPGIYTVSFVIGDISRVFRMIKVD